MIGGRRVLCRSVSTTSHGRVYPNVQSLKDGEFVRRHVNNHDMFDEILRVDHAGEYGAVCIYDGQMAFTSDPNQRRLLQHMKEQEVQHLESLRKLMPKHRARPTALLPLWHVAGYALGAVTAMGGKEMAMACTVAVEEVITEHYDDQLSILHETKSLDQNDEHRTQELVKVIKANRDDEDEHRHTALEEGAEQAPFYQTVTSLIKTGCNAAIWVAKRV